METMINKWRYRAQQPFAYGLDTSYQQAAAFLDGHGAEVEDWGCGGGWARHFFTKSKYIGIDGSQSKFCDKQVDLQEYTSTADCILVRHVLEHNHNWSGILKNAVASFQKRMVIVTFMPFSAQTHVVHALPADKPNVAYDAGIPNISLNYDEFVAHFKPYLVSAHPLPDNEHMFFLEKRAP